MDVDEALSRLGKFGRWQVWKYVMVCMSVTFSGCWHMMAIVFTGESHHCHALSHTDLEMKQWNCRWGRALLMYTPVGSLCAPVLH